MSKSPIRTAVAGLGRSGWDIHVVYMRGRKDFVITDVLDSLPERLQQAKDEFGCNTFTDWKEFLKKNSAELIVVATPTKDHAWMSIEALKSEKRVLVEKPMATNLKDVDRVIATAKKMRKMFTVHQNLRLNPEVLHVRKWINSGKLGRIFEIKRCGYQFGRRNDWQTLKKYGGGVLGNWGVHVIDQAMQFADSSVKRVFGTMKQTINPGDCEDHVKVVIETQKGMIIDIELASACALPVGPDWTVMGTRGTLNISGGKSEAKYYVGNLKKLKSVDKPVVVTRKYGIAGGDVIKWKEEKAEKLEPSKKNFYDYLYGSVREGKKLLASPESVRNTMLVLSEIVKSTGRIIRFI